MRKVIPQGLLEGPKGLKITRSSQNQDLFSHIVKHARNNFDIIRLQNRLKNHLKTILRHKSSGFCVFGDFTKRRYRESLTSQILRRAQPVEVGLQYGRPWNPCDDLNGSVPR